MAVPSIPEVQAHIAMIHARAERELRGKVINVWSPKGGVGKTTLAAELAMVLGGVLCDLDWDAGGATRSMGYFVEQYARVPLLEAIRKERLPMLWRRSNRPPLIPSHPDIEHAGIPTDVIRDCLIAWAKELDVVLVVDNHPGNGDMQFGAASAADVIVSPVELATKELNAAEVMLETLEGYPILLVPNMVDPNASTAREVDRLRFMADKFKVPIGPVVRDYAWLRRRLLATMVCAGQLSKRTLPFVWDIVRLAEEVEDYAIAR